MDWDEDPYEYSDEDPYGYSDEDLYEDPFTRGGMYYEEQYPESTLPYPEFEFGASVTDYERAGAERTFLSPEELRQLHQDPKRWSDYLLKTGIYQDHPFDTLSIDTTSIYNALRNFPHLETRNIHLLVAAYLYRQKYPKGRVTSKNFLDFYKQFEGVLNKVDLLRYIMIYDQKMKK